MANLKKKKWTVFFLVKAVDDSINDLIKMIEEILEITPSNNISIILCLNVLRKYKDNIEKLNVLSLPLPKNHSIEPLTTLFYSIEKLNDFHAKLNFIDEDINFDITSAPSLIVFFKKMNSDFPSERHIIFTWNHGSRYGVFKSKSFTYNHSFDSNLMDVIDITGKAIPFIGIKDNNKLPVAEMSALNVVNDKFVFNNLNPDKDNITTDTQSHIILTVEELSHAIKESFEKARVEIVIMMNCYMQFFDAGYALRKCVSYFVAPESYMYFSGYNYTAIFSLLNKRPSISSGKLVRYMVRSFKDKNFEDINMGNNAKNSTALFANNLHYYDLTARLIKKLSISLKNKIPTCKDEILNARKMVIPIESASPVIDFFNLIYNLRISLGNNWACWTIIRLHFIRKKIIMESYIGYNLRTFQKKKFPSGFSIFFPIQLGPVPINKDEFDFYLNTSFAKDNPWSYLVLQFFIESQSYTSLPIH
jgi:hypothetical protein